MFKQALAASVLVTLTTLTADAQVRISNGFGGFRMGTTTIGNGQRTYTPATTARTGFVSPMPSFSFGGPANNPSVSTPRQFTGVNPWTGGFNTGNRRMHASAFAPGRDLSRFNGTARQVNRPIYDSTGRVTGWQTGTEWVNSFTGQRHGDFKNHRPNAFGGADTESQTIAAIPPQ